MNDIKQGIKHFYIGESEANPMAIINWSLDGDQLTIESTWVSPEIRNEGVGTELVNKVIEYARENDLKVASHCSFSTSVLSDSVYNDVYVNM